MPDQRDDRWMIAIIEFGVRWGSLVPSVLLAQHVAEVFGGNGPERVTIFLLAMLAADSVIRPLVVLIDQVLRPWLLRNRDDN